MLGPKPGLLAFVVSLALLANTQTQPTSAHRHHLQQRSPSTGAGGNFCQGCKSLVSFVRTFNSSSDRSEYRDLFGNFCQLYYPASTDYQQGPCPLFVEGLFYVIDHVDPVEHCDQIGACGQRVGGLESAAAAAASVGLGSPTRQGKVICEFCEQIVEQTQAALSDAKMVEQVKQQVDALCEYLAVVDQDRQCKQLANKYIDAALDFIRHLDPQAYCRSIQLCSSSSSSTGSSSSLRGRPANRPQPDGQLGRLPTLTDFQNFGIETSVTIGDRVRDMRNKALTRSLAARWPSLAQSGSGGGGGGGGSSSTRLAELRDHRRGPNCVICKTVVREMFHFLKDNKTEQNIMLGLDKVCRLIYRRGAELDQCQSMVKAYTRELIQLLIDETDPEMICMLLEQCVHHHHQKAPGSDPQPQGEPFNLAHLISALDSSIPLESSRACFECKLFVRYLRDRLEDPKSQEYLRDWLVENLCEELGDNDLARSCTKMVDDYAETFFKAVLGSLKPQEACQEFGVCKAGLSWAERLVVDASAPAAPLAHPFLRQPSQPLAVVVSHPQQHPQHSQQQRRRRPLAGSHQAMRRLQGQLCDECVDIVQKLDVYLSSHSIDGDVSQLIEQVCDQLPNAAARKECAYLVHAFGADIAQLIAQMDSPKELCGKLMLCSAAAAAPSAD